MTQSEDIQIDWYALTGSICSRSLYEFVKEFWDIIIKDPYEDNWHIEYLCDEIQLVYDKYVLFRPPHIPNDKWYVGITEDIKMNLLINIAPGTSKSTIVSRMAPAWLWAVDSTKTFIGSTIDPKNASEFSRASMDVIASEKFQRCFPKVKIRRQTSAVNFYQSVLGGIRYSLTTLGSKTGKHGHILNEDDQMDIDMANSAAESKRGIDAFKAFQTRKKDKRITPYICTMQKLSNRDTSSHIMKVLKDDLRHICLPAENIYKNIKPEQLEVFYIDGLLDPNRLSREVLYKQKMGLTDESKPISEIDYNIQFNQALESAEGLLYPFMNLTKLPEDRTQAIRFSFTDVKDEGKDYFATIFCEINFGRIWVYDAIYTQESAEKTSEKLKIKIELHSSQVNKIESNNMGSVFAKMMTMMGVNVSGYTSSGNKAHRISASAQLASFVSFAEPFSEPFHTNEYSQAIKHMQSYPNIGTHEDGKDDIEDAFTEMLQNFFANYKGLFVQQ